MRGKRLYWIAFVITVFMLAYRDIKDCHDLPWPPRFVGAGITFIGLDLFSIISEELAGIMAIGIVIAVLVNKGFKSECNHSEGTVQPASYQSIIPGANTPPGSTLV
jgi:hypothetical protein